MGVYADRGEAERRVHADLADLDEVVARVAALEAKIGGEVNVVQEPELSEAEKEVQALEARIAELRGA